MARPADPTIDLETHDLVELRPGQTQVVERTAASVVAAEPVTPGQSASVLVDLRVRALPAARPARQGGAWLVLAAYVLATAALALAIYERVAA